MTSFKLSLDAARKNGNTEVGKQIINIENQNEYDFQYIRIEKIKPNPKNDYPMEAIEKLKESIRNYGLTSNISVAPIEADSDGKEYVIISGEQRYRAIKSLMDEGISIYKNGIPCKVESKERDEIDQEIMLIEANEVKRPDDPVRTRKMAKRLEELYLERNMKKGEITKKIAETLNIGERQVQRYRNTNNNLIPELIEALDSAKISLEMASNLAGLSVDDQKNIAAMISELKKVSKNELAAIQKTISDKETMLENQLQELKNKAKQEEKRKMSLEAELEKKEADYILLKNKLGQEKNTDANDKLNRKIEQMNEEIASLKSKKELAEMKNKELSTKIEDLVNAKPEKNNLSETEINKIKDEKEMDIILSDIEKSIAQLKAKLDTYIESYGNTPRVNEIKERLIDFNK